MSTKAPINQKSFGNGFIQGLGLAAGALSTIVFPPLVPFLAPATPFLVGAISTIIGASVLRDYRRRGNRFSSGNPYSDGKPGSYGQVASVVGLANVGIVLTSMLLPSPVSVALLLGYVGKEVSAGLHGAAAEFKRRIEQSRSYRAASTPQGPMEVAASSTIVRPKRQRDVVQSAIPEFAKKVAGEAAAREFSARWDGRNTRRAPAGLNRHLR